MDQLKQFKDLPPEKQKALKLAGGKMVLNMFFNGLNFGGLLVLSNFILVLAHSFHQSTVLLFTLCVITNFLFIKMMMNANKEAADSFKTQANKILDIE